MNKAFNLLKKIVMHSKLLSKIALYFKKRLVFFFLIPKSNENQIVIKESNDIFFEIVTDYSTYLEMCKSFKIPFDENKCLLRFENKCIFYFLRNKTDYLTYGWSIEGKNSFLIEYLNVRVEIGYNNIILFDFMTNSMHRQKGFYKLILSKIKTKFIDKPTIIYTAPSNIGSIKGISASGFIDIGIYSKPTIKKMFNRLKTQSPSRLFIRYTI